VAKQTAHLDTNNGVAGNNMAGGDLVGALDPDARPFAFVLVDEVCNKEALIRIDGHDACVDTVDVILHHAELQNALCAYPIVDGHNVAVVDLDSFDPATGGVAPQQHPYTGIVYYAQGNTSELRTLLFAP
jgi:hypothetical protein